MMKMSKVYIGFKTPDAAYYALQDIQDEDERAEAEAVIDKFLKYGECVTLEFDIESGKAKVLER